MHLIKFKYWEHANNPQSWYLDEVNVGSITLVVGRNSAGKTRTLNILFSLASLLSGARKPNFKSANFVTTFDNNGILLEYELSVEGGAVTHERLKRNGTEVMTRGDNGVGKILAEKGNQMMDFMAPLSDLVAVARRDSIQHSYFEALFNWGNGLRYFRFGSSLGKDLLAVIPSDGEVNQDPQDTNAVIGLLARGQREFGEEFDSAIFRDMQILDYDLSEIGIRAPTSIVFKGSIANNLVGIYVKEKKLNGITDQNDMSQGMFRALSVIVQINYAHFSKHPSCILIDDIGEGLDYERSCSLVRLLIDMEAKSGVQLLMSTNDRFVMNSVPLEYWAVIVRSGHRARVLNKSNSEKAFDEFKFTGLNNFDFFAKDFLHQSNASDEENSHLR